MRPLAVVVGVLVAAMGTIFALQGAGVLPTTFMVGPLWIGIGSALAVAGVGVAIVGVVRG